MAPPDRPCSSIPAVPGIPDGGPSGAPEGVADPSARKALVEGEIVRRTPVVSIEGEKVGTVDEVVVDRDGRLSHLVVDLGLLSDDVILPAHWIAGIEAESVRLAVGDTALESLETINLTEARHFVWGRIQRVTAQIARRTLMLTPHGWKSRLSPRRGFTVLQARIELSPPVVLALHDSTQALGLFRSAIEEARGRYLRLVVLDYGVVPLKDLLWQGSADSDPREQRALRALWSNPHVRVIRAEDLSAGLHEAVGYCESQQASLLIVAADVLASVTNDPELGPRILNAEFDLLVVTEHQGSSPDLLEETDSGLAWPAPKGA